MNHDLCGMMKYSMLCLANDGFTQWRLPTTFLDEQREKKIQVDSFSFKKKYMHSFTFPFSSSLPYAEIPTLFQNRIAFWRRLGFSGCALLLALKALVWSVRTSLVPFLKKLPWPQRCSRCL